MPDRKDFFMKELKLEARIDSLDTVLGFIDDTLDELGCDMKIKMQIDVAAEELYVNIASYAYVPDTGEATIQLDTLDDNNAVSITFIDSGTPFDPLAKADPDVTLSASERQIGGLGIFMVKQTMDAVEYEYKDGSNILTLVKNL